MTIKPLASLLAIGICALTASASAQFGRRDVIATTASLRGHVLEAASSKPVRGAVVLLDILNFGTWSTITDAEGRFEFSGLPPNDDSSSPFSVSINAKKAHFSGTWIHSLKLRDQATEEIVIRLQRGGAVAGRVVDDTGEAVAGVGVSVWRIGTSLANSFSPGVNGSGPTDDAGAFQISGIPPGEYRLVANLSAHSDPHYGGLAGDDRFASIFYPGTIEPDDATPINIAADSDISNLRFVFRPERLKRIWGMVVDSEGRPAEAQIRITDRSRPNSTTWTRQTIARKDGRFHQAGLEPGIYEVEVTLATSSEIYDSMVTGRRLATGRESATLRVPVTGNIESLVVRTSPPGSAIAAERLSSQESLAPQGRVRGRVISERTGEALRMAIVELHAPTVGQWIAVTDQSGVFEIPNLPAESFSMSFAKAGFTSYQGSARTVTNEAGAEVEVRLRQSGAIAGRINDEFSEPLASVSVHAYRREFHGDGPVLREAASTLANQSGEFRLSGLQPGTYFVAASVGTSGDVATYAHMFFPGVSDVPSATALVIAPGSIIDAVNFQFRPVRLARATGSVVNSKGEPAANASVTLHLPPFSDQMPIRSSPSSTVRPDGTFTISNVPPGDYLLEVRWGGSPRMMQFGGLVGPAPTNEAEFATMPVHVGDRDLSSIDVTTRLAFSVRGHIVIDQLATDRVPFNRLSVHTFDLSTRLDRFGFGISIVEVPVTSTGIFDWPGLTGRHKLNLTGLPPGWILDRIRVDGRDVTYGVDIDRDITDLEIVVTNRVHHVAGTLAGVTAVERSNAAVVLIPSDPARWRDPSDGPLRWTRVSAEGRFRFDAVQTGDYFVAAVDPLPPDWNDPVNLAGLAQTATKIAVGTDDTSSVTLRQPPGSR